jgi:P27 family predicted phage terminase small subunit
MPGPPPKPNEIKRKTGNPGKRKLPKASNVIALPPVASNAPEHLGPQGKELWAAMRERAAWLAETDRATLLLVCEMWDRRADLMTRLAASDPVLYTDKGYAYANPIVGMLSTMERDIARLFGVLGFTPADRTRMGLAEVKAQSKLAELRERSSRGAIGD